MTSDTTCRPIARGDKRHMAHIALALWRSLLIGNPPPVVTAMLERMRHPQPGDLVMETSTLYMLLARDTDLEDDRWDGQFVPFIRTAIEPMYSAAEWRQWVEAGEVADGPPPTERVWYCRNPDGTEFRWHNAELVAVPDSPDFGRPGTAPRNADGSVTFTRGGLVDALADSGFALRRDPRG